MLATPLDIDFEAELLAFQRKRVQHRTPGVHLSDILHYFLAKLEKERFGRGEPIDLALVQGGFIWEDLNSWVFSQQFGKRKNIEIERDGILMSPDGFHTQRWRVQEWKDTKISAANPIRSARFLHWHMQIMAYCYAMDTREAELVVRFINGSYEMAGGRFGKTAMKGWALEYAQRELAENWDGILRMRDEMEAA